MTTLLTKHPSLSIPLASQPDLEPARRLIVLIPNIEADLAAVTQRVWELASATGAHIKFLSLCTDQAEEPSLRRHLATLSAFVNDGSVTAEAEVVSGKN